VQHIEMARDFAQRFNHLYGEPAGKEHFTLPEVVIEEQVATLPGLDGRKMSKSYDNTIPLFAPREQLRKLIFSIVTDSRAPGEPKDSEGSALFQLYRAFASGEETERMRRAFADGIAWGEAKERLFERIDVEVAPLRARYETLVAQPEAIERQLRDGAARLREEVATPFLRRLREAVGLRDLAQAAGLPRGRTAKATPPQFKQYRDADGRFYFKLHAADGRLLLQSIGHDSARDAGQMIARLKREGERLRHVAGGGVHLGETLVGKLAEDAALEEAAAALAAFAEGVA